MHPAGNKMPISKLYYYTISLNEIPVIWDFYVWPLCDFCHPFVFWKGFDSHVHFKLPDFPNKWQMFSDTAVFTVSADIFVIKYMWKIFNLFLRYVFHSARCKLFFKRPTLSCFVEYKLYTRGLGVWRKKYLCSLLISILMFFVHVFPPIKIPTIYICNCLPCIFL